MSWPTPTMKNKKNGVANMGNRQEMESSWLRWLLSDDCHRSCKLCHVIAVWWHWQSLSATSEATDNQIWFCFMLFYVSFNRLTIKFLDHCKTIWYDYNNQYEIFWWQTPAAFPIQSCSNEMKPHRRLKNTKLRKYPSWLILPVNCMYPLAQRLFVLLCAIDWYYTVCSIQWYWCMQCKCWPAMISCFGALNRFLDFILGHWGQLITSILVLDLPSSGQKCLATDGTGLMWQDSPDSPNGLCYSQVETVDGRDPAPVGRW